MAVYRYDNDVVQVQPFSEDSGMLRSALDELKDYRPVVQFYPRAPAQPGPVINGIPVISTASSPGRPDKRVPPTTPFGRRAWTCAHELTTGARLSFWWQTVTTFAAIGI